MNESFGSALKIQLTVISAIVLRDMKTRFGRTYLGYVIAVLWPLSHLLVLMTMYSLARRIAPIGDSSVAFYATGVLPYILCLYPSRWIMLCIVQNRPLLSFPVVKAIDLIMGRIVVEVMTVFYVLILFLLLLFLSGVDIMPLDVEQAIFAILASVYFAIGLGIINAILLALTRAWMAIYLGSIIGAYITSGALVMPSNFPPNLLYWISFNPLFQCVEWLRSAYYEGYGDGLLDRGYLLGYSTVLLLLGLAAERAFRGRIAML